MKRIKNVVVSQKFSLKIIIRMENRINDSQLKQTVR